MTIRSPTRICLVDDDEDIRDALEALFRSRRLHVSVFGDPERFLSIWKTSELREVPATFVLDVAMPGLTGIELFRRMREHGLPPHNTVLFLTGHGDIPLAVEAMKQGAFDFIEKPFSDNSLVDRVIEGCRLAEQAFDSHARLQQYETALTAREREVADLLVQGLTNKAIAARLDAAVRTVEGHRARIFEKLDVRNAVELATAFHRPACPCAPGGET